MSNIPTISTVEAKYLKILSKTPMTTLELHDTHFTNVQLNTSTLQINKLFRNNLVECVEENTIPTGNKAKVYATTQLGIDALAAKRYVVKWTVEVFATSADAAIEKAQNPEMEGTWSAIGVKTL